MLFGTIDAFISVASIQVWQILAIEFCIMLTIIKFQQSFTSVMHRALFIKLYE